MVNNWLPDNRPVSNNPKESVAQQSSVERDAQSDDYSSECSQPSSSVKKVINPINF